MAGAMSEITLAELYVYPIKSAAGIPLNHARLDARGIVHDRRWMLVDENGKFMSQRRHPKMALITPSFSDGNLVVEAPGMPPLDLPPGETFVDRAENRVEVRVWSDDVRAAPAGREADGWFGAFLGVPCRLVYMPEDAQRRVDPAYSTGRDRVGFADGFPFLLVSGASLRDLGDRLGREVPVNRFRPNLVVEGCAAFEEDRWRNLRVGSIDFRVAKPCSRCSIVMTKQETGERDREVLRTLAGYRRAGTDVFFGQNLIHTATGTLRVGDAAEADPARPSAR